MEPYNPRTQLVAGKKRGLCNEQKRGEQRDKTVNKKYLVIATLTPLKQYASWSIICESANGDF